jgi:type I restriction enzyme, S subunit
VSFPKYADYYESGVAWLGVIPKTWRVQRFRRLFRESAEKIEREVVGPMLSVSGYRGIEIKEYDDDNRRRTEEELIGYRIVRPGQLVVNTMWLNYAGLGVSEHEGHVSPAYRSYWISPDLVAQFIHYLLRSGVYVQGYTQLLTGIRPNSLQMSRDDLMEFPIVLPPRNEQADIARFLDRETASIDALLAEQQRLIQLLKEKRQAVISHAVTKGLNPDVPMKASGVEGLGEVPAHWRTTVIKRFAELQRGHDLTDAERTEGVYPVVTSGGISGTHGSFIARGPGVVTGRYGSTGRLYYIEEDFWPHNTSLYVKDFHENGPRYVWYSLQTVDFAAHSAKAAVPGIDRNDIHVLPVAVPPQEEQHKIVDFLDSTTGRIDALIRQAGQLVDLLEERRTALISAAVTGKIDVRHLADAEAA